MNLFSQTYVWQYIDVPDHLVINDVTMSHDEKIYLCAFLKQNIFRTDDLGKIWIDLGFPDICCEENLTEPTQIQEGSQGEMYLLNTSTTDCRGLYRSTDHGVSWHMILNNENDSLLSFDISRQGYLFVVKKGNLQVSIDNGESWHVLFHCYDQFNDGSCGELNINYDFSKVKFNENMHAFKKCSYSGAFNICKDDRVIFLANEENEYGNDPDYFFGKVFLDLNINSLDHLFILFHDGLYCSKNWGQTWERLGFDDGSANGMEIDFYNYIYIYTMKGFYVSYDEGVSWKSIGGPSNVRFFKVISDGSIIAVVYDNIYYGRKDDENSAKDINVIVQTEPRNLLLMIDGSVCSSTQSLLWQIGSVHSVSVDSLIPAIEDSQFVFTGWSDGGNRSHQVTVTQDLDTLTALYQVEYELNLTSSQGTVQGAGWYAAGSNAEFEVDSLVVDEDTRYLFNQWSGDYTGTEPASQILMDSPKTVSARWQTQFQLQVTVQDDAGGAVIPAEPIWVASDETSEIEAIPDEGAGFAFIGWTGDVESTTNPLTVTMSAPKLITAVFQIPSSVEVAEMPTEFAVRQNYSNPFNPETRIAYEIPKAGEVTIEIFDLTGRKVRTLVHASEQPGSYQVVWDGRNDAGRIVSSGTYIYVMRCGGYQKRMKAVFLK